MKRNLQHIVVLILATMLSLLAGKSFAQSIMPLNTGDDPYLGTTHSYVVEIDDRVNNDYGWKLVNGGTTYDPSNDFISTTLVGNTYTITIEFTRDDFTPGTWTLRYEETSRDDGACVATREYIIYLSENEFYESLYDVASETPPGSTPECHDSTNTVQVYANVNSLNFQTEYIFPVYMYKQSGFKLNTWHFDATVAAAGYTIVSIGKGSSTTNMGADYSISQSGGVYTVVADSAIGDYDSDYVELSVVVEGPMFTDFTMTLDIDNAYAISGSTGQVTTEDNVHIYPDESGAPAEWRTKTVTIRGVPETRDITHNTAEGETEWSAQNPLQNSTHHYIVEMGDDINNGGAWHIIDNAGVPVPAINYSLTEIQDGTSGNSEAEFTFNMDPGAYTLVFTETNGNSCISLRHYPITLGGPFVVSIAEVGDNCASASGNIYGSLQSTDTEITYTVTLETSYRADWDFEFDITSSFGFASPDLEYTVTSVTTGANYDSGTGD
ncbi:MAG TPA: hypothetical protein PLF35_13110, partial [Prolixibacteraceae bacterium]|nr:hypothetical protein [Prolixibacteraceae bacterium]